MNLLRSVISSGWQGARLRRSRVVPHEPNTALRPRLLTDVSVIMRHDARTGIQRVVRAVWNKLLEQSGAAFEVVPVFAARSHGYRYASPDFLTRAPAERTPGGPVQVRPGDRFFGLDLSAHLLPSYGRQISAWRAKGVSTHLVVYDLLPLQRPDWFNSKTVRNFRRWIEVVRNQCDQALCISDHVAKELRAYLGDDTSGPEIGRIRLAGDIEDSLPSGGIDVHVSRVIERVRRMPTVLMVGTIEPRKAYDVALAAFDHLWKYEGENAPALVIVGQAGWRTEALQERIRKHPEMGRKLHWLEEVSDEALAQFYQVCRTVLLTSASEGFGLPAAEAALHRRWTLVRDLPVFSEQQLPNLRYFTKDAPDDLAQKIMALLQTAKTAPPPPSQLPGWSWCVDRLLDEIGAIRTPRSHQKPLQLQELHTSARKDH